MAGFTSLAGPGPCEPAPMWILMAVGTMLKLCDVKSPIHLSGSGPAMALFAFHRCVPPTQGETGFRVVESGPCTVPAGGRVTAAAFLFEPSRMNIPVAAGARGEGEIPIAHEARPVSVRRMALRTRHGDMFSRQGKPGAVVHKERCGFPGIRSVTCPALGRELSVMHIRVA
jgi:hypothetical protein